MALEIIENRKVNNIWSAKQSLKLAIVLSILGIIIFIVAFVGMSQKIGIGAFNQPVLNWMISHRDTQITKVMQIIATAASPTIVAGTVIVVAGIWAATKRELCRPLLLVGTVGVAAITAVAIKIATANVRPPQISMIAPLELDYSFPSGHVIGIATLVLIVGYLICSRGSNTRRIISWIVITIICISAISASRLYLGYHWVTDVTASVGLALIILSLAIFIDLIVLQKITTKSANIGQ